MNAGKKIPVFSIEKIIMWWQELALKILVASALVLDVIV